MSDLMFLMKSQGVLVLPFLISVFLYFTFVQNAHGDLSTTLLKCFPITLLMLYILLKGFDFTQSYKTSQRVLLSLVFSCAGDALLNIDLFPHGMGAFAIAQILYISAFGWKPLVLPIGLAMYLAGASLVALVFNKLDNVLMFGLPIYTTLLLTMSWRAIARSIDQQNFLNVLCAAGSILFVISDSLICISMFYIPIPNARVWIMITYYIAQFAIAISTANESKYENNLKKLSKPSSKIKIYQSEHVRRRFKSKD